MRKCREIRCNVCDINFWVTSNDKAFAIKSYMCARIRKQCLKITDNAIHISTRECWLMRCNVGATVSDMTHICRQSSRHRYCTPCIGIVVCGRAANAICVRCALVVNKMWIMWPKQASSGILCNLIFFVCY